MDIYLLYGQQEKVNMEILLSKINEARDVGHTILNEYPIEIINSTRMMFQQC